MLIALTDPIDPAGEAILRGAGHQMLLAADRSPDGLRALCAEADAVVVRTALPDDIIDSSPRLLAAVRHGVGVDMIPVASCTAHGVVVANAPGANREAVAEFALAQMLAAARHVEAMDATLRTVGWAEARARSGTASELRGRTLGIVGIGAIGARLARIAALGFDMRVLGHRRDAAAMPDHAAYADLPALFAESDYLVLACPLTEATRGLASAALIGRMKPTAWLINVARGAVVDEAALVAALRERRIGGAALDVFASQPLAPDHPLRALPNVILTPHTAGLTQEAMAAISTAVAHDVVRVLAGRRPENFVNPEAWPAAQARRRALGHAPAPQEAATA